VVTYVTCSPHALETSLVVRDVTRLLAREGLSTEILHAGDVATRLAPQPPAGADREMLQLWPHLDGTDAMFCAVLRRTS
jgi:tRNA/rRNA cytosine-C5-methylase